MNTGVASGTQTKCLSEARRHEILRIVRLHGGRGFTENLSRLGALPGATIRVLAKGRSGPVVIECKGGRIAIGRGMAERVEVAKAELSP